MGDKRQLLPLISLHYFLGPEKGASLFLSLISYALYQNFVVEYRLQNLSSHKFDRLDVFLKMVIMCEFPFANIMNT